MSMVRLVDEALKSGVYFGLSEGLASQSVTVADPAMGRLTSENDATLREDLFHPHLNDGEHDKGCRV